jgi:hypothetical protein
MMTLVDACVWSVALRRQEKHLSREQKQVKQELAELILEGRAQLIGAVRQEVLSGIRTDAQYQQLRAYLKAFPDPRLTGEDYEEAASINNRCRAKGVTGSATDFLICAVAMRREWAVFTTDEDFIRYARCVPIQLYTPRIHQDRGGAASTWRRGRVNRGTSR